MGEYADLEIDRMIDMWGSTPRIRWRRPARVKVCNRCGESDLRWQNVKGGHWRLHTPGGELHVCAPNTERLRGIK